MTARSLVVAAGEGALPLFASQGFRIPAFTRAMQRRFLLREEKPDVERRNRRDAGDGRAADDVGGVEPAAEPDLEQHEVAGVGQRASRLRAVVISKNVIGASRLARFRISRSRDPRLLPISCPAGDTARENAR